MVVVEEASTDSNERLKSSVEKGDPLHRACWCYPGWVCMLVGMKVTGQCMEVTGQWPGIVCVWRCDEWVAGVA